jgi:hypothetical protein
MKDNYRIEITYWGRTPDGDDAIDTEYWINTETLQDALDEANKPKIPNRLMIESRIYDCRDKYESTPGNLIYRRDWIKNKVTDYTTLPDLDYHNREYE